MPEVLFLLGVRAVWADLRVTTMTPDPSSENQYYENEKPVFVTFPGGDLLS